MTSNALYDRNQSYIDAEIKGNADDGKRSATDNGAILFINFNFY